MRFSVLEKLANVYLPEIVSRRPPQLWRDGVLVPLEMIEFVVKPFSRRYDGMAEERGGLGGCL